MNLSGPGSGRSYPAIDKMRVVGGTLRGRRLASFKGLAIRPTSDRVREAVFNVLPSGSVQGRRVLDLYAGTGAMGIEALSRGAGSVLFVEKSEAAITVIKKNLTICGLGGRAGVIRSDVLRAVGRLARNGESFDIVFIDPPYEAGLLEKTLRTLDEKGLVSEGGMVVAECSKRLGLDMELKGLKKWNEKTYGDTRVYFFIAGGGKEGLFDGPAHESQISG